VSSEPLFLRERFVTWDTFPTLLTISRNVLLVPLILLELPPATYRYQNHISSTLDLKLATMNIALNKI